jgi:adenylate cyclase
MTEPARPYALTDALAEVPATDARWEAILRGEHPLALAHRAGRRAFALLPSPWRCKYCNAPFNGPCAGVMKWIGYSPSRKNPSICARCLEAAPEGGAVVPLTILFADVRGYTALSEQLGALTVTTLVTRFYRAASAALLGQEGLLGQIAGDQVTALFVPGLAGPNYRAKAVEAGRKVLAGVGYGAPGGAWLDVGVGIASGEQFVGNVAGGGFKDFASVGDVTNVAARLTASARGGEILVDSESYAAVATAFAGARRRDLQLKGKSAPVPAYAIPLEGAP